MVELQHRRPARLRPAPLGRRSPSSRGCYPSGQRLVAEAAQEVCRQAREQGYPQGPFRIDPPSVATLAQPHRRNCPPRPSTRSSSTTPPRRSRFSRRTRQSASLVRTPQVSARPTLLHPLPFCTQTSVCPCTANPFSRRMRPDPAFGCRSRSFCSDRPKTI